MTRVELKLVTYYNKVIATFGAWRHVFFPFHSCQNMTFMIQCISLLLCSITGLLFLCTKQCSC